jgi:hypothetical protein
MGYVADAVDLFRARPQQQPRGGDGSLMQVNRDVCDMLFCCRLLRVRLSPLVGLGGYPAFTTQIAGHTKITIGAGRGAG